MLRRIDTIYRATQETLRKPQVRRRIKWGAVLLILVNILGWSFGSYFLTKPERTQAATLTYVGGNTGTGTGATYSVSLTALTGGASSSAAAGDLVVVVTGWASTSDGDPGVSSPTGYTEEWDTRVNDSRDTNISVNWKIMGATPDTSVTVRGYGSASYGGSTTVHVWRNVDQTTPLDSIVPQDYTQSGNSAYSDSPSKTPSGVTGSVVLAVGMSTGDATPTAMTGPSGMSNWRTANGVGSTMSAISGIASYAWTSGAYDPAAWTGGESTNSDSWAGMTLVVRPRHDITVAATGTQTSTVYSGTTDNYVGGAFTFVRSADSADVTQIIVSDTGTINADSNLSNLDLYYETTGSCSYDGGETLFGTASSFSSEAATVTGTMAVGTSQVCIYAVVDVADAAGNGDTIEIQITNPSTQVTVSAGAVTPATTVAISGTTTVTKSQITVSATGTQTSTMSIPSTDQYVGGAFTFVRNNSSADVTQIIVSETGTVNASSNLSNLDLYYETAGTCSYDGGETLFGTASSFSSESATVTGTMSVGTSQVCVYAVLDVSSGASASETIEIQITDPSTQITVSAGTVTPATPVAIAGTTTLTSSNSNPDIPTNLEPDSTPDYVDDGWTNDNTPTFSFDITDPDPSEQVKYRIQIDDSSDFLSLVVDYEPSSYGAEGTYNYTVGQAGTYYIGSESMTLSDASAYYWRVKAIDDDLAESAYEEAGTDGVTDFQCDATAPTGGTAKDGQTVGADLDWNTDGSLTQLLGNWDGTEPNADVSGTANYDYALRRKPDDYYWTPGSPGSWGASTYWYDNDLTKSFTVNSMNLQTGVTYYISLRTTDNAGNSATIDSNGINVSPTLSFSFDTPQVTFTDLGNGNNWTDTKNTVTTVSTNAANGYNVQAYIVDYLKSIIDGTTTIPDYSKGTYASPVAWSTNCPSDNTYCGFGYTVNPSTRFSNGTLYAPYYHGAPGQAAVERPGPVNGSTGAISGENRTITHKVSVSSSQMAGPYQTTLLLIVTPNY